MSWQAYIDDQLMCDIEGGKRLTSSAILGQDGIVWAQSPSFPQLTRKEIDGIFGDFDKPGSLTPTGLYIGGTKYMVMQGEPGTVIRGTKGSGGVIIRRTDMSLIFGIYDMPVTPDQCNIVVQRVGDYLSKLEY